MNAEYVIGGIYLAAAPVEACLAFLVTFVVRRLLLRGRIYRWFWHPILADMALFVIVWALLSLLLLPLIQGSPA